MKRKRKKKKVFSPGLVATTGTKSGGQMAHPGAPFSPGCCYQPGLKVGHLVPKP